MPRKDFLLAYLLESVFDNLSDEQAGKLIKAIFDYEIRKEEPAFEDSMLQFVFDTVIKPKSEDNMEKYQQTCESRRKNAQSRWKRSGKQMHTNDANAYKCMQNMQMHTNDANECKRYRYDIDNDNDKSLSISTEAEKIAEDFSQLLGNRKIGTRKRLDLFRKYQEMRKTRSREEVDSELLDYLAQG